MDKVKLLERCREIMKEKLDVIDHSIQDVQDAVESEDKNSAGDKYETGRAMAQEDLDRLFQQKALLLKDMSMLQHPSMSAPHDTVQTGSVIHAGEMWFYIGPNMGKVKFEDHEIFMISTKSPLAVQMLGKTKGQSFNMNNRPLEITEIF
ncbi:MAG: hypothetical protein GC181_03140 [Bacteroidetes bacterium]|nr:hypothetical protein [Bacteroidota bacterium]